MSQNTKPYHTIRSVSELLGVPASTLRYWETVFPQLSPERTRSGQRRYTVVDVETARRIRELLHEKGLKIEAAKEIIGSTRKHPPRNRFICGSREDACDLLREVTKMVGDNLHAVARIEAVEEWLRGLSG